MEWITAILGIVSLVGGIIASFQANKQSKETDTYNRELNQTIMDREDTAWQRAVNDRAKSGLSIAGLSQGAGSGGTVSQLQSQQSGALQSLSNVLQNGSGTMFGLANSAYDRKLQKQIATEELELKKQQLQHEKLTTALQYKLDIAQYYLQKDKNSDEHKIFEHNYKIATGEYDDPKKRVYGSEPSEIERIITALWNNREKLNPVLDTAKDTGNKIKDNATNTVENLTGNSITQLSEQKLKEYGLDDKTINSIKSGNKPTRVTIKDNKYYAEFQNIYDQSKTVVEINKKQFKGLYDLLEDQRKNQ